MKQSACNAGDLGSIPGLGRSPGEGHGNPLQYSCLEESIDRGAWKATVHGIAKCWTWLSDKNFGLNLYWWAYEDTSSRKYHFSGMKLLKEITKGNLVFQKLIWSSLLFRKIYYSFESYKSFITWGLEFIVHEGQKQDSVGKYLNRDCTEGKFRWAQKCRGSFGTPARWKNWIWAFHIKPETFKGALKCIIKQTLFCWQRFI